MSERAEWTTTSSVSIDIDGPRTRHDGQEVDEYALTFGQDDSVFIIEGGLDDLLALSHLIHDKVAAFAHVEQVHRILRRKGSHGGLQRS